MIVSSPDTEAISSILHAYGAALKARNVEEVLALYTTDGVIMPPHFPASAGVESLRASYTRIFSTIELVITFQIEEIVMMSPEWGFARTTAEGTKTILALNESESHANQELFIMKKEHGKWLIARYAFSTMKPLNESDDLSKKGYFIWSTHKFMTINPIATLDDNNEPITQRGE
ncbi:hypothetical protein HAV15_006081 [Penicillium sp. str. |nr:hypothetical protein HAV15_006081 [Penicillium sp. str. \